MQRAVFMVFLQRVKIEETLLSFAAFPDVHEPIARKSRRIPRSSSVLRRDATVLDMSQEITRHTEVYPAVHEPTSRRVSLETAKILNLWGQLAQIFLIIHSLLYLLFRTININQPCFPFFIYYGISLFIQNILHQSHWFLEIITNWITKKICLLPISFQLCFTKLMSRDIFILFDESKLKFFISLFLIIENLFRLPREFSFLTIHVTSKSAYLYVKYKLIWCEGLKFEKSEGYRELGIGFGFTMRLHLASSAIWGCGSNRDLNLRFRRVRTLHVATNAGIFSTALHVPGGCRARPRKGKSRSLVTAS